MISLQYPSQSPRWPDAGIFFEDWSDYSFVLGYFSNPEHHYYLNNGQISIHIEPNQENGAYNVEGRIHIYDNVLLTDLQFDTLNSAKSAGNGRIVNRVNCNEYVYSLLNDYGFIIAHRDGSPRVADLIPPTNVGNTLERCEAIIEDDFRRGFNY